MEKPEILQTKFQKLLGKSSVVFYATWVATIIIFVWILGFDLLNIVGGWLAVDILLGVATFILAVITHYISRPRPEKDTKSILTTLGISVAGIGILITLGMLPSSSTGGIKGTRLPASPLPPITTNATPQPTPAPKTKTTISLPKSPQITCTGPDYKTFQTTEAECIKFRTAWGLSPSATPLSTTAPQRQQSQTNSYLCRVGTSGYTYYTKDANECTQSMLTEMNRNSCLDTAKNGLSSCQSACDKPYNEGKTACTWAYTGNNPGIELNSTKYNECLDELYGAWTSCRDTCMNSYPTSLSKCN